jgi:hypothetical protein
MTRDPIRKTNRNNLIVRPTGWPTTQHRVYRAGQTMPLGKVLSEYNLKTKKWEPVVICRG